MHICITGAAGSIGSRTVKHVLSQGHSITAIDIVPLPQGLELPAGSTYCQVDCTDFKAFEEALLQTPCDGVIHLGAIPNPISGHDQRTVHNVNVVGSYNVMRTAADHGIRKIVQASSVNATGLIFTHESRRKFDEIPLTELSPRVPEDAYSLSKTICEIQADSICRLYDDCRISSLRFHMTCDRDEAIPRGQKGDLWSWTSLDDAANACLLGITANEPSFQRGHEPFYILHDDLFLGRESWEIERGVYDEAIKNGMNPDTVTAKELIDLYYPGTKIKEGWFDGNPRRSLFDNAKAKELLGWDHVK